MSRSSGRLSREPEGVFFPLKLFSTAHTLCCAEKINAKCHAALLRRSCACRWIRAADGFENDLKASLLSHRNHNDTYFYDLAPHRPGQNSPTRPEFSNTHHHHGSHHSTSMPQTPLFVPLKSTFARKIRWSHMVHVFHE